VAVMKDLLGFVGLSPKRLRLEWIATSESNKFANVVTDFTREIGELGPSPLRKVSSKKEPERVIEPFALQP
jgi:F420-non-reducing hydrogenase iron-sulfur subunit